MPDLKEILAENYSEEIASKLKGFDIFEKGKAMPIEKFNAKIEEINTQKKELKEQVDTLNNTLKTNAKDFEKFKAAAEGNADLQKQLQEYQDKMNNTQKEFNNTLTAKEQEWQKREVNNRKSYSIREKLLMEHADPEYIDLLMKEINLDSITEADGKFIGVDDVVNGVKTNFKKLFGKPQIIGTGINNGDKITSNANLQQLADKARSGRPEDRIAYMKAKQEINNQE